MPWCPICKDEYRDGFNKCKDCNVDLVEKLEAIEIEETIREESGPQRTYFGEETFLMTVNDEYNLEIIRGFFENEGIPLLTKRKGTGNMHSLYMGIDIYVPLKQIEEAKILLNELGIENEILDKRDENRKGNQAMESEKPLKNLGILVVIVVGVLAILVWGFLK